MTQNPDSHHGNSNAAPEPHQAPGETPPAWLGTQQLPTVPAKRGASGTGRTGFAAAVLAASLLLGGTAGVAGAAAWTSSHDGSDTAGAPAADAGADGDESITQTSSKAPKGSVEKVASTVLPSVVKIDVLGQQGSGSGSGVILSKDGQILTNNHVVEVAADGGKLTVAFNDGSTAEAEVVGTDPLTDTAVIQAKGVSGLTPVSVGKSSELSVGQDVVAVGSPFGLESTVTSGIVSALDRPVNVGSDSQGNSTTYPAIQTDAAINPGNSGGPLVDMEGNLVGINSSIRTASSTMSSEGAGSIGLGFSIPIDEVMPIVEQMLDGDAPTHAQLGISVADVGSDGADDSGAQVAAGAAVRSVNDGSTAGDAGLEKGDVITKVDQTRISGADSLVATIRSYRPGDEVELTYVRDGEEQTTKLELGSDAESS